MKRIINTFTALIISLFMMIPSGLIPAKAEDTVSVELNMYPLSWYKDDGDWYSNEYYNLETGQSFNEYGMDQVHRFPTSHELIGFYVENTGEIIEIEDFYDYRFYESCSLSAIWDGYEHTVTFRNDAGYFNDDPSLTEFTVTVPFRQPLNSVLKYAPFPNMTSGAFDFWRFSHLDYEDYSPLGSGFMSMRVNVNYTVTPSWKSGSGTDYYVVKYEPNGGYFTDTGDETDHMKEFIPQNYWGALNAPEVMRDGYALLGWSEDPECEDTGCLYNYQNDHFSTGKINHVYAVWKEVYTVTWENYDGEVLEVDEGLMAGETPEYNGETPTREDDDNRYTFSGWTPEVSEVTGDITYTAEYDSRTLLHTVTWKNYDGTVLETDENVREGTLPEYNGETPEREETEQYVYEFQGWEPEVTELGDGDVVYTAKFREDSKTAVHIYWADGAVIEAMELVGGTEEEPVIVTVGGTVTMNGTVTVSSGYVKFVGEEGKEAILLGNHSGIMVYISRGAYSTFEGLTLDGDEKTSDLIQTVEKGLEVNNCVIRNGRNCGIRVTTAASATITDTRIENNGTANGYADCGVLAGGSVKMIRCEIQNNHIGYFLWSGTSYLEDVSVKENRIGMQRGNNTPTNLYLQGEIQVCENTEKDLDNTGYKTPIYVSGPLNGNVYMTNRPLDPGETIIAVPGYIEGTSTKYTITETDVSVFHYIPTEEQLNGNAVIGSPRLNSAGNVVVNVFFKTYVRGDTEGFILTPVEGEDEEVPTVKGTDEETGEEYYLIEEGKETTFELEIREGYHKGEDFSVRIDGEEVPLEIADNSEYFKVTPTDTTEIEITGIEKEIPEDHDHVDEDGDLVCDICGERTGYRVTLTSRLEGSGSPVSVAPLQGGGIYRIEDGVTEKARVTASYETEYDFRGWYQGTEDGYTGEAISTNLTYEFTPEEDTALVAVYAPTNRQLIVKVTGNGFRITGNNNVQYTITKKYTPGTSITVSFVNEDREFLYWTNETGKILSRKKDYTFTAVSNACLEAVSVSEGDYMEDGIAYVEFLSYYDQVISAETYSATDTIEYPTGPSRIGYNFTGWDKSPEDIQREMYENATHITVRPEYEKSGNMTILTVRYKDELHEAEEYQANEGTAIRVTAAEIEGYQFASWRTPEGVLLSTAEEYSILTVGEAEIVAEYVSEEEEAPEKRPVIAMTGAKAFVDGGANKVTYIATRSVPEGYTIESQGIIRSTSAIYGGPDAGDIFVIGGEGVKKSESSDTDANGVYSLTLGVGNSVNVPIYGRGYMIVKDSEGNTMTIYSENIYSYTYNELSGEK